MSERTVRYNPVYSRYFNAQQRTCVLYGGRGSGKSVAIIQKHVKKALETPGYRHLTIRKVLKTCRHSTFQLYRDELQSWGIEAAVNRVEMMIGFPNGSQILHAGLDDPLKLLSITGIDSVHIEEADQITESEFEEVDVLMRGTPKGGYHQSTLSFNPRRGKLWIRRRFVDAPDHGGAYVLKTTWRDNRFIGREYGERLAAIPDANLRAIYEAGEWGEDVRGLVYPSYTTAAAPTAKPDAYGVDFGFTHPTAVVAIWDRDPFLHVQQMVYATNLQTPQLIEALRDAGVDKDVPMYCDAAQPGTIAEIQGAGYNALPADKKVEDGIASVKRFTLAFTPDSVDLIDEADAYVWMETRDGALKDQPVKAFDHGMDAMRYAVHTHLQAAPAWGLW